MPHRACEQLLGNLSRLCCSVLVDRKRGEPHEGRIYVMRTEDGLVVKRVGKDEAGRWQIVSDHPDWEAVPMLYGTEIIGEVALACTDVLRGWRHPMW